MTAPDQTICLCMIVKDEAPVIGRCLLSVLPIIDHYVVVDTGSSDETRELARQALHGLPGILVDRPWVDFGHNRSEALALARPRAAYTLIIDADDELLIPPGFVMPRLDADSYEMEIEDVGIEYGRTQLVSNALAWRYAGVLHEYLTCPGARSGGRLALRMRRGHDGRRRRDPATYRNDAAVLARALESEGDPFLVARYTFYLAQSLRDAGDREAALEAYLRRAELGHWDQEIFVALLSAARLMEALGRDLELVLATYAKATAACPDRVEAAHGASRLCRYRSLHDRGYALAAAAVGKTPPQGGLFVEGWIDAYGLLDEFAVHASWTGRHADSRDACLAALASGSLPEGDRARIAGNLSFAQSRLAERWNAPDGGWRPERPLGGTELMLEGLRARLGGDLDRINLCVTAYETVDERPLVVWIQHDIDQQAIQWLDDAARRERVARFVFVSDWQRARFVERFGLAPERCTVMRNAADVPPLDRAWNRAWDQPSDLRRRVKLAYASTPYRGLAVLLDAYERLGNMEGLPETELHVWSSHKLYGPSADDAAYEALYARARAMPNVRYHGIAPNAELRETLRDCDLLAYPNTFAETSCITAIEALAAGCRIVCPTHGALPETTGGFAALYPFTPDPDEHARRFAETLAEELRRPWGGEPDRMRLQQRFARETYAWPVRVADWRALIETLANERARPATPPGIKGPEDRAVQALTRLRDLGFAPTGIIDAGAYRGDFTRSMRSVFPEAFILMVDALAEQAATLDGVCREVGNAAQVTAMLGARDRRSTAFFVADTETRPDLVKTGSSKFKENTGFPMLERRVPQRRMRTILRAFPQRFQLLKLDLQGAELEALQGFGRRLSDVEAIVIEMSVVPYNRGAPPMHVVIAKLAAMDFVLYDLVEEHRYRDGSLLQVDGLFLRQGSRFRPSPPFWT